MPRVPRAVARASAGCGTGSFVEAAALDQRLQAAGERLNHAVARQSRVMRVARHLARVRGGRAPNIFSICPAKPRPTMIALASLLWMKLVVVRLLDHHASTRCRRRPRSSRAACVHRTRRCARPRRAAGTSRDDATRAAAGRASLFAGTSRRTSTPRGRLRRRAQRREELRVPEAETRPRSQDAALAPAIAARYAHCGESGFCSARRTLLTSQREPDSATRSDASRLLARPRATRPSASSGATGQPAAPSRIRPGLPSPSSR